MSAPMAEKTGKLRKNCCWHFNLLYFIIQLKIYNFSLVSHVPSPSFVLPIIFIFFYSPRTGAANFHPVNWCVVWNYIQLRSWPPWAKHQDLSFLIRKPVMQKQLVYFNPLMLQRSHVNWGEFYLYNKYLSVQFWLKIKIKIVLSTKTPITRGGVGVGGGGVIIG